jgi:hypothetical protein
MTEQKTVASTVYRLTTASVLLLISAAPAHALTTFTAGTPAKASEVNDNFTELSDRIDALEAKHTGETINVDCGADAGALLAAMNNAGNGDTFVITGTCNGPVFADHHALTLQANTPGVDGITAPGDTDAVLSVLARHVTVQGLVLTATVPSSSIGLLVFRNGSATIDNLAASGAEYSVVVARAASARIQNTGDIDVAQAVSGGSLRIEGGNSDFRIGAYRNGTVEIRSSAAGSVFEGIELADGGVLRTRGTSTNITVNGKVALYRSSNAYFEGPLTLNYDDDPQTDDSGLIALENSTLRLRNATINTMTEIAGSSTLRAFSSAFREYGNPGNGGFIYAGLSSVVVLHGGSAGGIELTEKSSAALDGATLSGTNIWGDNFALEIDSSAVSAEGATINDDVYVVSNGVFEMEGSTLNGDLIVFQNSSVSVEEGSAINATRAAGGTCPTAYNEGIQLDMGSMMVVQDAASTLSGYLNIGYEAGFGAWELSSLPNVDAQSCSPDFCVKEQLNSQGLADVNACM